MTIHEQIKSCVLEELKLSQKSTRFFDGMISRKFPNSGYTASEILIELKEAGHIAHTRHEHTTDWWKRT